MTRPSSRDPIDPMDLANMRQNGVRSLDVQCWQCRHETIINADHWPGNLTVKSFEPAHGVHEMRNHRRRRQA